MLKARFLLLSALLLLASNLPAVEPSFTVFPDVPGKKVTGYIRALSANGEVAVGQFGGTASSLNYPFRWTGQTDGIALGSRYGFANDVSADGNVIVGFQYESAFPFNTKAFRWTAADGIVSLEALRPTGYSQAYGVSGDGRIVFGISDGTAVRWTADGRVMRLNGGGHFSAVGLVSWDGSIAAGVRSINTLGTTDAFRWSATEGMVLLGRLPGGGDLGTRCQPGSCEEESYYPTGMTPDGRVIWGGTGFKRGFRWTAETGMVGMDFIPAAVSDDGRVMVGGDYLKPFIWTAESGALDLQPFLTGLGLDLSGWTLTSVTAISGDGTTIAGDGIPPGPSIAGAWIATIPEPSTWAMGGTALAITMLGMFMRRQKD